MALLRPKQKEVKVAQRIVILDSTSEEVKLYCNYAGFNKPDEFFEEAALHVMRKDKKFKEWKEKAIEKSEQK